MTLRTIKLLSGAAAALARRAKSSPAAARALLMAAALGFAVAASCGHPRAAVLFVVGFFLALPLRRLPSARTSRDAAPARPAALAWNPRSPASRLRSGWCREALARDRLSRPVFPRESSATAWSLLGAVAASYDCGTPEWADCFARLRRALGAPPGDTSGRWLAEWNDDPSRTQADAVAAAEAVETSWGCYVCGCATSATSTTCARHQPTTPIISKSPA
jgi:hypothetical protein